MELSGEALKNLRERAKFRDIPIASRFMSRMAESLLAVVDDKSAFGRRLIAWPDTAGEDALALRAIAGFHALKLSGAAPELTPHYPPFETSDAELQEAVRSAIAGHDAFLTEYLDSPPQTNETGRSSMVLGAALHVANATGLPIETFEIGASAGLNLWFERYTYDFGNGLKWGSADAPLTVRSDWSGAPPPLQAPVQVTARHGCDRNPLDPKNPDHRLRLTSYVWPDQSERLDRVAKALAFAAAQPVAVEKADAADWVEQALLAPPQSGVARMIYHTVVWQYLPEPVKARITDAIQKAAATATAETPLAWFRFENDDKGEDGGLMELTHWPGGETRKLGRADFHGRWVEWA